MKYDHFLNHSNLFFLFSSLFFFFHSFFSSSLHIIFLLLFVFSFVFLFSRFCFLYFLSFLVRLLSYPFLIPLQAFFFFVFISLPHFVDRFTFRFAILFALITFPRRPNRLSLTVLLHTKEIPLNYFSFYANDKDSCTDYLLHIYVILTRRREMLFILIRLRKLPTYAPTYTRTQPWQISCQYITYIKTVGMRFRKYLAYCVAGEDKRIKRYPNLYI